MFFAGEIRRNEIQKCNLSVTFVLHTLVMEPTCFFPPPFAKQGFSLKEKFLQMTAFSRMRRSESIVAIASCPSDGSVLTQNSVFFFDAHHKPLYQGFGLLSWHGWQEKQQMAFRDGVPPPPWQPIRQKDGWTTYSVYNPYLRLEDYAEAARRHSRDIWGNVGDDKRIELRMVVMSQTETNREIRRQMAYLLTARPV